MAIMPSWSVLKRERPVCFEGLEPQCTDAEARDNRNGIDNRRGRSEQIRWRSEATGMVFYVDDRESEKEEQQNWILLETHSYRDIDAGPH
eukprot:6213273-Pleurochrysis_carterae.AAC.2